MDVRVPLEVASECMKSTHYAGTEMTGFVLHVEVMKNYLGGSSEKTVKEPAVYPEIWTETFGDGKDNVPVSAVKHLSGYACSTILLICNAT